MTLPLQLHKEREVKEIGIWKQMRNLRKQNWSSIEWSDMIERKENAE